jgi:branched-chain amino acid transport system ATP-binding protein
LERRRTVLRVENASVAYGQITAVREVSLTVNDGEIVTIIGANGAGKSSLLNAIAGVVPLKNGIIRLGDRRISGLSPHKIVGSGIAYIPEGRQIFGAMSVKDNLTMGGYSQCARDITGTSTTVDTSWIRRVYGHARRVRGGLSILGPVGGFLRRPDVQSNLETVFKLFPILKERIKQPAGSLSGGEQQMLAIGRALMSSPKMLLLDEPSLGLAPNLVREILKLIARLRDEGLTILLVEQDANAALKIADRGYVMERGHITIEGTFKELLGNDKVRQAYLGKSVA